MFPISQRTMMQEKPTNRFCAMFGHNLKHVADIDHETVELVCKSCHEHFIYTKNDHLVSVPVLKKNNQLDSYFKPKKASSRFSF